MSRLTNDHTNFNIHWDDLLEMELTNAVEIDAAEFCAKFSINPEDFDSDFVDETANINVPREVCIMSDSQLSEEARHLVNTAKCPVLPVVAPPIQASSVNPVNETETINNTIPNQHEIDDSQPIPNGFINVTEEDVKSFNEKNKNKNTARKKEGNMRKLSRFLSMKNESRKMYDIPMCELDEILAMFILSIRKEDGGEYETTSIRSFSSTIEKVLQENNYPYTLAKGERQGFPKFRETIAVSMVRPEKCITRFSTPQTPNYFYFHYIYYVFQTESRKQLYCVGSKQ